MAKSRNVTATPAAAPARLGSSTDPVGRSRVGTGQDKYGYHFKRTLPCGQYICYTVTPSGWLVEKVNFVPSKERRDGNAAWGRRWLAILAYRQSADYAADLQHAAENGMVMDPPANSAKPSRSGVVAC